MAAANLPTATTPRLDSSRRYPVLWAQSSPNAGWELAARYAAEIATENWPAQTWDKDNYVSSGGGFSEGPGPGAGLTRTIEQTIAKISGTAIAAAELVDHTFTPSKDTYRDLAPDGVWHFTEVAVGAPAPALASGRLRVAVTRTDAADIIGDMALCSFSIPYGGSIDT